MRIDNLAFVTASCALLASSITSPSVSAGTIFERFLTGEELADSPDVSFPTDQPKLIGSSLEFFNKANEQVLLRWELLPQQTRNPLRFIVTVDYTALKHPTSDNDPIFAISDGDTFGGIFRVDNAGGSASTLEGTVTTTAVSLGPGESIGTNLDPVEPFVYELLTSPTLITGYAQPGFVSEASFLLPGAAIDPSAPLSLILASGSISVHERYRVHSLGVVIQQIPEPATATLFLILGPVGWAACRKQAHHLA